MLKIEKCAREDVYDFTVPATSNFYANGILVHNCGEQTLPAGGVCDLGTTNLTQYVRPDGKGFDIPKLTAAVKTLVRFLDNVNSRSRAPLPQYEYSMQNKRRIGCGVMGYASSLFMMRVRFGSPEAAAIRDEMISAYARAAYEASIDLAVEKGMFSLCDPLQHAEGLFISQLGLSEEYMTKLRKFGIRNSALLSQQPNGNSSIFANIVSGGIEPIFMPEYVRTAGVVYVPDHLLSVTPKYSEGVFDETSFFKWIKEGDEDILMGTDTDGTVYKIDRNRGMTKEVLCEDYGVRYLKARGEWDPKAPWAVTTTELSVMDHVNDLRGFSRYTDSACSKCLSSEDTMVILDGKIRYLDELPKGEIDSFEQYSAETTNHMHECVKTLSVYNNGPAETLTVQFDDGSSLICTPKHRIFTSDGWVRAEDIRIGSQIVYALAE